MRASVLRRFSLAALLLFAAAPLPRAEPPSPFKYEGMLAKPAPKAQAPEVRTPPVVWPRLDAGAVVCRTEADLLRRAAAMRGDPGGPADCRIIGAPTGIQIIARHGPGRTEVQFGKDTAWTDAWLPATPPRGATPAAAR